MAARDTKPWFRVKRLGYGVGFPIAWEGWLLLVLYMGAMILSGSLLPTLAFVILAIILTAGVLYISYIKSDDEWRFRNGD